MIEKDVDLQNEKLHPIRCLIGQRFFITAE
jgi:hypothetical protein